MDRQKTPVTRNSDLHLSKIFLARTIYKSQDSFKTPLTIIYSNSIHIRYKTGSSHMWAKLTYGRILFCSWYVYYYIQYNAVEKFVPSRVTVQWDRDVTRRARAGSSLPEINCVACPPKVHSEKSLLLQVFTRGTVGALAINGSLFFIHLLLFVFWLAFQTLDVSQFLAACFKFLIACTQHCLCHYNAPAKRLAVYCFNQQLVCLCSQLPISFLLILLL